MSGVRWFKGSEPGEYYCTLPFKLKPNRPRQNRLRQNRLRQNRVRSIRNTEDLCVICYSNLANITLVPCGHDNICENCYLQLNNNKCPFCRAIIETYR